MEADKGVFLDVFIQKEGSVDNHHLDYSVKTLQDLFYHLVPYPLIHLDLIMHVKESFRRQDIFPSFYCTSLSHLHFLLK